MLDLPKLVYFWFSKLTRLYMMYIYIYKSMMILVTPPLPDKKEQNKITYKACYSNVYANNNHTIATLCQ